MVLEWLISVLQPGNQELINLYKISNLNIRPQNNRIQYVEG
jgi:hypothetical protein